MKSSDEPVTIEPIQMEVIEEIEGGESIGFVSATDMDDGNIIYYYIVGEFNLTVLDTWIQIH